MCGDATPCDRVNATFVCPILEQGDFVFQRIDSAEIEVGPRLQLSGERGAASSRGIAINLLNRRRAYRRRR
jgi:hypothetical protein